MVDMTKKLGAKKYHKFGYVFYLHIDGIMNHNHKMLLHYVSNGITSHKH